VISTAQNIPKYLKGLRAKHMPKPSHLRRFAGDDKVVAKSRQGRRSISAVMQKLRDRFGPKAPLEIALRADVEPRSSERWLSGKSMMAENFIDLVRSDVGDAVIDAAMGDDPLQWPEWYVLFKRQVRLSKLRRDLADQQREIAALEAGAP
jgi:hypothetical protein